MGLWLAFALLVSIWLFVLAVFDARHLWGFNNGGGRARRKCCWEQEGRRVGLAGVTPAGLAFDRRGRYLYVANNNNYGLTGGHTVTVMEPGTLNVIATLSDGFFNQPYTVTPDPCADRVYVTNSAGTSISVIDTTTNLVLGALTGFDGPSGLLVLPSCSGATGPRKAYVNNYGGPIVGSGNGTTVAVVELDPPGGGLGEATGQIITVALAPAALACSPDGTLLYVLSYVNGNPGTGVLSVINTATEEVTATLAGFSGPFAMAVSSDGRRGYVTNFGSNNFTHIGTTLSVVDLERLIIVQTVSLGLQPSGIALSRDGRYAYVTNYNSLYDGDALVPGEGSVSVLALAPRSGCAKTRNSQEGEEATLVRTLLVGQSPSAVVVDRQGRLYVSNYTSNTVSFLSRV